MMDKRLENYSEINIFTIDIANNMMTIIPTGRNTANYLLYTCVTSNLESVKRIYSIPAPGIPIFIPEMSLMAFATKNELEEKVKRYGSGKELISAYLTKFLPMMQGSYKVIVNLSDNDYYFIENKKINKLPKYDPMFRQNYINYISQPIELNNTHDLLIVVSVLKHDNVDKPIILTYENKFIDRNKQISGEPIIIVSGGFAVFNTIQSAESFLNNYDGDILNYLIEKSKIIVKEEHEDDLKRLRSEYENDKGKIMKNALLLGGTTIAGVVAEKVIEYLLTKKKGKSKLLGIFF